MGASQNEELLRIQSSDAKHGTSRFQFDREDADLRFLQEDHLGDRSPSSDSNHFDDNDIQTGYGLQSRQKSTDHAASSPDEQRSQSSQEDIQSPTYDRAQTSMECTKLTDFVDGVTLRKPCLLLQQGLYEHVFEFVEIRSVFFTAHRRHSMTLYENRLLHPSDPAPQYNGHDVYPVTTYLSRLQSPKCTICEKDPASRITLHDELSGVSPCYICNICFDCFHRNEEEARANGVVVIP